MRYSDIDIEDIESYTLNEARAVYGEGILPLWKDAVYTKPYKIESRRYIGCKAKLVDWIFGIIERETHGIESRGNGVLTMQWTKVRPMFSEVL